MKRALLFSIPLIVGILIALSLWNNLWLPFSNPLGITSDIATIHFNPSNNTFRFLVLLLVPVICLVLFAKFSPKRFKEIESKPSVIHFAPPTTVWQMILSKLLVSFLAILFAMTSPTFIASGNFDTFHEGESLGPAVSYQAGQVPYKDFVVIHGVYQDPLRAVTAFSLFGKSIGATRTWESIVKILTWILLGVFLLDVFEWKSNRAIFVLGCLGFLSTIKALTIMPRDITTILYLLTFPVFLRAISDKVVNKYLLLVASFGLSFIPLAGLGMSVDRGVYYLAMTLFFTPLLYFFYIRKTIYAQTFLSGISLGISIGAFVLGTLLHWNFSGFYQFCFVMMPEYKDLMDGFVYTIFNPRFGVPAIICAFATYLMVWKFLRMPNTPSVSFFKKLKEFVAEYLVEIAVLMISLLLFRNALGRADWTHINYSWFGILMFLLIVFAKDVLPRIADKFPFFRNNTVVLFLIAIVSGYPAGLFPQRNAWHENFPLGVNDSTFIPEKDKTTIDFLKKGLKDSDDFLTLTDEAAWYYYLDKPCPIRFNIIIHAMHPKFQQEVVDSLQKRNVKYVLYHNNHWANFTKTEGKQSLPIVMDYIHAHFRPFITLNDNEIWIKSTTIQASN